MIYKFSAAFMAAENTPIVDNMWSSNTGFSAQRVKSYRILQIVRRKV